MRDTRRTRFGVALPAELAAEIGAYAATHGLRRGEALRYLIEAGLAAEARAMLASRTAEAQAAKDSRAHDVGRPAAASAALTQAANDQDRACPDGRRARGRDGPPHSGG